MSSLLNIFIEKCMKNYCGDSRDVLVGVASVCVLLRVGASYTSMGKM